MMIVCGPAPTENRIGDCAYCVLARVDGVPPAVPSTSTISDWGDWFLHDWAARSESVYVPFARVTCLADAALSLDETDLESLVAPAHSPSCKSCRCPRCRRKSSSCSSVKVQGWSPDGGESCGPVQVTPGEPAPHRPAARSPH